MKFLLKYLAILLLLNVLFLLYLLFDRNISYPFQVGPQFDNKVRRTYRDELNANHQGVVLIGDSMLAQGVDYAMLAHDLDRDILNIGLPGSGSTLWYLILKNNLIDASTPPAYFIVFFRDSELTVPGLRVQGKYLEQIDEFASRDEPLLIQYAYINNMNPLEVMAEKYLPPFQYRWKIRSKVDYYIRYALPEYMLGCLPECTDQATAHVFGADNLEPKILSNAIDAADDYLYTREALDFNRQIDISFLPEMIRLCRENNVQLIAVHMKTLRDFTNTSEGQALERYRANLAEYFQNNGVVYLDFSKDERLPENLFVDPIHLNEEGRQFFTTLLAESLAPYIR